MKGGFISGKGATQAAFAQAAGAEGAGEPRQHDQHKSTLEEKAAKRSDSSTMGLPPSSCHKKTHSAQPIKETTHIQGLLHRRHALPVRLLHRHRLPIHLGQRSGRGLLPAGRQVVGQRKVGPPGAPLALHQLAFASKPHHQHWPAPTDLFHSLQLRLQPRRLPCSQMVQVLPSYLPGLLHSGQLRLQLRQLALLAGQRLLQPVHLQAQHLKSALRFEASRLPLEPLLATLLHNPAARQTKPRRTTYHVGAWSSACACSSLSLLAQWNQPCQRTARQKKPDAPHQLLSDRLSSPAPPGLEALAPAAALESWACSCCCCCCCCWSRRRRCSCCSHWVCLRGFSISFTSPLPQLTPAAAAIKW